MKLLTGVLLLVSAQAVFAADTLIRVDCMEGSAGAEVSLNGHYQFTCSDFRKEPIALKAGEYTLSAVKKLSKTYQQMFTRKLSLKAGIPQRVRVTLPEKSLTEFGKAEQKRQQEQARLAAEAEKVRKLKQAVSEDMASAKQGKLDAMKRLAERYRTGNGVLQDNALAEQWRQRFEQASQKKAREERIAMLKRRLDRTYFPTVAKVPDAIKRSGPIDASTIITALPAYTLADITSMPSETSQRNDVREELEQLETHASRWANPDSMVAKAYDARQAPD